MTSITCNLTGIATTRSALQKQSTVITQRLRKEQVTWLNISTLIPNISLAFFKCHIYISLWEKLSCYQVKYIYIQDRINNISNCELWKGLGKLILDKSALLFCTPEWMRAENFRQFSPLPAKIKKGTIPICHLYRALEDKSKKNSGLIMWLSFCNSKYNTVPNLCCYSSTATLPYQERSTQELNSECKKISLESEYKRK